jgi:hypothetical protein
MCEDPTKRRWFQFAACALLTCLFGCRPTSDSTLKSDDLLGTWKLIEVNHAPPTRLNIKSLRITFSPDGNWVGTSEMQGAFAGMSLELGGKWSISDGVLSFTSGDNSGKTRPTLTGTQLTLNPDFTLVDGGKEVIATYEQVQADEDR